ncbi:S8 family peptidase [Paenibacillus eucommiae]|uniref:Subtilisin family serine protease n=1 Tax=Paenibacillus eucommiae TaxID=1355755 RepID=A0ABS4J1Z5_9BACL|nr:S8 family peptidase [Paenibacillus eucommiae]MBP1992834.1 subtilisin family serine protease [Paenibacillus eucommiae]
MWRYISSFLIIMGLGMFVFSSQQHVERPPQAEIYEAKQEVTAKETILKNDIQVTDELCRTQCSLDLKQMSQDIMKHNAGNDKNMTASMLHTMRTGHEKMDMLMWTKRSEPLEAGIQEGTLPSEIQEQVLALVKAAKVSVDKGTPYQSPLIGNGSRSYFVLGVVSEDDNKSGSLIGVIHQDILQHVTDHQLKNLRLEPYPKDNHWKTKSVETGTLREKVIDHPEDNQNTSHYHENEVVVRFRQNPTQVQLAQITREINARSVRQLASTYVFIAEGMEAKQLIDYFSKWNVDYVEPHYLYLTNDTIHETKKMDQSPAVSDNLEANFVPNDQLFKRYQWNLPLIETTQGWQVTRGAEDVIVGVVDTGADLNHQDLKDHLVQGYNVVEQNDTPDDDVGHGTHVTGVISAVVNNNLGVAGMTWYNKVMPVKVLDQSGAGSTYSVAEGIIWATDHGAKVINMSLGNYADSSFLHDAIRYAFDRDVVLIAASGNDNTEQPGYPAAYPEVLAVAATDAQNNRASFSNYGDYIDVAAPGVNIASTYLGNQYAALSGTSMASPHVTALAALIRSTNPNLKNTEVYDVIRQTAQDLGPAGKDNDFGYGIIDVVQALQAASNQKNRSVNTLPQFISNPFEKIQQKLEWLRNMR